MSVLPPSLEALHFIRPLWLLLLPVILGLWLYARRNAGAAAMVDAGIAAHLRQALTVNAGRHRGLLPIDGVSAVLALAVVGGAGPTWSRVPDPFVAQTAPLVVVLKVTPSMNSVDVAPSRLERAKQKIRDLLQLRAGARTALVAYSGSVHTVLPMTEDPQVMQPYLEGLTVDIMPKEGDETVAAIGRATSLISAEAMPGAVLLVADNIAPSDVNMITPDENTTLGVLSMLPEGANDEGARRIEALVVSVTADDSDVRRLDQRLNADYQRALTKNSSQPWDDRGWMLAWPALLVSLFWFRRGWTMRWLAIITTIAGLMPPFDARATGIADWFLTADQQGRIAYQRKSYDAAASLFVDPLWKGWALYRSGQYGEATRVLRGVPTAEAALLQGMAHIRTREYREGIAAFELALERQPDYPAAAENLETAKAILAYVEEAREQSDTGEDGGIGADDIVFDNEDARGADTTREEGAEEDKVMLSADQWMNTVDTDTGDFLRQRFAVEALEAP